nr:hypothetical protein [Tanacetum cinerariifolium]
GGGVDVVRLEVGRRRDEGGDGTRVMVVVVVGCGDDGVAW